MAKLLGICFAVLAVFLTPIAGVLLLHAGPAAAQPVALADPAVKHCLFMAYRRENPKLASNPMTTTVEYAAQVLDTETVAEGLAVCRRALTAFPSEPKLIIANHTATEVLYVLLFGLAEFPKTDADAVVKAHILAAGQNGSDKLRASLAAVLLGTAYEYGIGTDKNPSEAPKWYQLAAGTGSKTGRRELERISSPGKE